VGAVNAACFSLTRQLGVPLAWSSSRHSYSFFVRSNPLRRSPPAASPPVRPDSSESRPPAAPVVLPAAPAAGVAPVAVAPPVRPASSESRPPPVASPPPRSAVRGSALERGGVRSALLFYFLSLASWRIERAVKKDSRCRGSCSCRRSGCRCSCSQWLAVDLVDWCGAARGSKESDQRRGNEG
jgi:hypothetical protein